MNALDQGVTTNELYFFHGKPRECRKAVFGRKYMDNSYTKFEDFFRRQSVKI